MSIDFIVIWVLSLFEVWMCFWCLGHTIMLPENLTLKNRAAILICIGSLGTLMGINRSMLFFSHNLFWISLVVSGIFALAVIRYEAILTITLVVLYYTVVALIDFILAFFVAGIINDSAKFSRALYEYNASGWSIGIFLCTRLLLFFLLWGGWKHVHREYVENYRWILLVGCVLLVLVLRINQILLVEISDGTTTVSWSEGVLGLIACLALYGFVTAVLLRSKKLKIEHAALTIRNETLQNHYKQLQWQWEERQKLLHDVRNHIQMLKGFEKRQDLEGLHDYLEELGEAYVQVKEKKWCEHPILNMILNQKFQEAKERNILFEQPEMQFQQLPLTDREVTIIFGNLLDNAIEACDKMNTGKRWIRVSIQQRRKIWHMEISNSVERAPKILHNMVKTDKKHPKNHGYGLKSVRSVVETHEGVMELTADAGVFCVRISFFCNE